MDPYQSGQVDMFVNVTGASEADARAKIREFRGNLNAAIDSYLSEKENPVPQSQAEESGTPVWKNEDEPPLSQRISSPTGYPLPSAPTWATRLPRVGGAMAPLFPFRRPPPFVTQPRDVREIPIDWGGGNSRVGSSAGLLIEEIPATFEETVPSQRPAHFVTEADEDPSHVAKGYRGRSDSRPRDASGDKMGEHFTGRRTNLDPPFINEVTTVASNEGDDLEEDILRAVIEASQNETTGNVGDHGGVGAEDDDFARAVTLSLKTAEQEKALREGKEALGGFSESANHPNIDKRENLKITKRRGSSSARANFSEDVERMKSVIHLDSQDPNVSANNMNSVAREDEAEDRIESLVRRRSGRLQNQTGTSSATHGQATLPRLRQEQRNLGRIDIRTPDKHENGTIKDEWGGLSSEEQEEAVMLEAAMFGSFPENAAMRFGYPSIGDTDEGILEMRGPHNNTRPIQQTRSPVPIQQPPSPTVVAQRLLREQQDDEYLASLVADREKEEKAQIEKEEKAQVEKEEKAQREREARRLEAESEAAARVEEKKSKDLQAKRAGLPQEPSVDDETAVTLMVRMPDGTRKGRRFYKSEPLRCLLDFIDASCGPLPSSYQVVRPYPRQAFTSAEQESSFQALGLNSKYETLFLEFV